MAQNLNFKSPQNFLKCFKDDHDYDNDEDDNCDGAAVDDDDGGDEFA